MCAGFIAACRWPCLRSQAMAYFATRFLMMSWPRQRRCQMKSSTSAPSLLRICERMASSPDRLPVTWPPLRPVAPQPILLASTMATLRPRSASSTALATPVKPPPMITTSTCTSPLSVG
ncbi:hypothetical protein FQZ97_1054880 [compost metagenome]